MPDLNHTYAKPQDYKEIKMADGRLIRIFTLLDAQNLWLTCIYDERQNIAWQDPHLSYQGAYNDFKTFCKLLGDAL